MWFRRDGNLQTMCLNVVVSRINILKSVPDVVHEKHIEYLRRAYSEELFKLITKRWYPNEYLVWLISPFWKNVHLPGLGFSSSDIISKFLCVGENIDSLHLDYSDSSPHFLTAMICCLPNITLLNLTGTLITDDILLLVRKMCPKLKTLNLSYCDSLTDKGMQNLCYLNNKRIGFPSLENLILFETHISIEGFRTLVRDIPSLKILNFFPAVLWLYRMHKKLLDHSKNASIVKYNLTNLDYSEVTPYANTELDLVLEVLSIVCPQVENVTIRKKITENSFRLLGKFKFLKELDVNNVMFYYPPQVPCVSKFLTVSGLLLTCLKLDSKISVSADVITNWCPNLKVLELCSVVYENFETPVKTAKRLEHLEFLCLGNLSFNEDIDFKSVNLLLSSGLNLNKLTIYSAKHFTDKIASVILELSNLETVDFSFTDINEETVFPFFNCPSITAIHLNGCPYISHKDENSFITKIVMNSYIGTNTCAWELGYD